MQQLSDLPDSNPDSAVATAVSVDFKLFKYGKVEQSYNRCTAFPTDLFEVFPVCASCLAIHGVDRRVPTRCHFHEKDGYTAKSFPCFPRTKSCPRSVRFSSPRHGYFYARLFWTGFLSPGERCSGLRVVDHPLPRGRCIEVNPGTYRRTIPRLWKPQHGNPWRGFAHFHIRPFVPVPSRRHPNQQYLGDICTLGGKPQSSPTFGSSRRSSTSWARQQKSSSSPACPSHSKRTRPTHVL